MFGHNLASGQLFMGMRDRAVREGPLHVKRKLLILLIIIITGTAEFCRTASFQKRIINNYNYWNCTLSWPRTVPLHWKEEGRKGGTDFLFLKDVLRLCLETNTDKSLVKMQVKNIGLQLTETSVGPRNL